MYIYIHISLYQKDKKSNTLRNNFNKCKQKIKIPILKDFSYKNQKILTFFLCYDLHIISKIFIYLNNLSKIIYFMKMKRALRVINSIPI